MPLPATNTKATNYRFGSIRVPETSNPIFIRKISDPAKFARIVGHEYAACCKGVTCYGGVVGADGCTCIREGFFDFDGRIHSIFATVGIAASFFQCFGQVQHPLADKAGAVSGQWVGEVQLLCQQLHGAAVIADSRFVQVRVVGVVVDGDAQCG